VKIKSADKRLAILKAAFAVVTERGYSDTKVDEVARRAGVAKGTVYLYFKDKPAIYIGLVDWLLEQALAIVTETTARPLSARDKLAEILNAWSGGVLSNPAVLALLSMENVNQTSTVMKRFRKHCVPHLQEMTGAIAALIRQGVETGEFRPVEPRLAALMFAGAFRAAMLAVANRWPVKNPSAMVQELFFYGMLAPAGPARSKHKTGS
jgi:AcrR family transcriptional regulator